MSLRVGFFGYRFMGKAHANALARLPMFFPDAPQVDRHVLIGRNETALAEYADRLGFTTTATDLGAVLNDIDILYTLTPNHLHAEPSIAALEQDVHVLCEKPLAATRSGAERMADAASYTKATASVAFNYRFVPALQYAKRYIHDGNLGEIRHVHVRYLQDWLVDPEEPWSWRNDEDSAGTGALGDLGSHTIDMAHYLVGDISRVSGALTTFIDERPTDSGTSRQVTVDDAATAQLEFDSGAMGVLETSRVSPGHKNDLTIEIHGTAGSLRFSLERLNELEILRSDGRGYERILVTDADDPYIAPWWPPGHVLGWEHTFVHENYEFLRTVTGAADETSVASFSDGLSTQRVIDAIQGAADSGTWVDVDS